ncbi:MAG: hypothetical protein NTX25_11195 [Proteobacteria bacterium]|nr:hypothetical protein [Pseudomonadota bacterium]
MHDAIALAEILRLGQRKVKMFDVNQFKKSVKEWIRTNPQGTLLDLRDFCDELVPAQLYAANQWLIDQTLSWYRHVLERRELEFAGGSDDTDD